MKAVDMPLFVDQFAAAGTLIDVVLLNILKGLFRKLAAMSGLSLPVVFAGGPAGRTQHINVVLDHQRQDRKTGKPRIEQYGRRHLSASRRMLLENRLECIAFTARSDVLADYQTSLMDQRGWLIGRTRNSILAQLNRGVRFSGRKLDTPGEAAALA